MCLLRGRRHGYDAIAHRTGQGVTMNVSKTRYYQVVFIWLKDASKFARYLELMAPIVRRYGGELERSLAPETIYSAAIARPDTINVVFYDSREAFSAFNQDPEFQKVSHLRSESIDMLVVGGVPIGGRVDEGGVAERLYVLEIARFGAGGAAAYRSYEEQAEPVLRRFGYHVERVLAPDAVSGFSFKPDIVKLAYFDAHDGMEQLHRDPSHQGIEQELYPSAVVESIWITAKSSS
jgi:uncharacterized protein (DUF1330 family)